MTGAKNTIIFVLTALLAGCVSLPVSQTATLNGVNLDYQITGDGPPLYMLHGGMESRDSFENQISDFADHFTVIALDSREQGRSGRSDAQITFELMSNDVVALAKHLGHERISIFGLSDGGVTAITTAINAPDLVDKLVLLGANYHYDSYPPETREFIANYKWDGNTDPNGFPGNSIKHYLTGQDDLSDFGELLAEMSIMWTTSPTFTITDLSKIQSKTLVINGDHEDMDLNHALKLYESLPNAELFIVPNSTHYGVQERPELINKVALDFLAK
jgi:pimeloyl-ACP methyl ester carboxylesterase